MKKHIIILFVALFSSMSFSACTDKEDVEISFEQNLSITAAHLFDNFEQFHEGDFEMSKYGWKLNLQALVYNSEGLLVDKAEKLCSSLTETLDYSPSLMPGEYTVVCIADFREGNGGNEYKYWEISNENKLQDISITENQIIFPEVYETLGIDIKKLRVKDKCEKISSDIKPVTCLVQIFMSDKDYSSWGMNGYSRYCIMAEGYFIKAIKFKNNIRFENGELNYKYSEQVSDYNIAISHCYEKWSEKSAPIGYCYRALLPEENKGFKFHIQMRDLPQDYYDVAFNLCGEFDVDGQSNVLPEIASNKQYVVNMVLDAMSLVAMELTPDFTHESYTNKFVEDYNLQLMEEMVRTKFENILGKDEHYANVFLDMDPSDHYINKEAPHTAFYPRSKANHFEQYVTLGYLNNDFTNCCIVQLLLPTLTDDMFKYLKTLLSEKFVAEEEGIYGPGYFTYIEPNVPAEASHYRIALEKKENKDFGQYTYFLVYNLRQKYF